VNDPDLSLYYALRSQGKLLMLEVALRDHWSCRTVLVVCSQAIPLVVLKCILLGLHAGSSNTAVQVILAVSLATSLVFIAFFFLIEVWSFEPFSCKKPAAQNQDLSVLIKRVRQDLFIRLCYKGGQGESQSVMSGQAYSKASRVVFVAPCIPPILQDRVATFRPNTQINLDDLELPGLHRLQKRKLMELAVSDRPRLLIANSIVASTSCASAANGTLKLTNKMTEGSHHHGSSGQGLTRASNFNLNKPRQTLLAIPSLSALQRLTSFCLPSALAPFLPDVDSAPAALEREVLLSLVSYEDAALQESHPYMECLLSSVLNLTSPPSSSHFSFGPSCLTTMMIKGTRLSPKCIDLLSGALMDETCSQMLSTLILSEAGFSQASFASVCEAISRNKGLRYLDLSCYRPGLSGAQALGAMLSANKGLVEVNLSYMGLVSSSAGVVLLGAGKSTSLMKLDLSQNHIKDDAPLLEHLVPQENLSTSSSLTSIPQEEAFSYSLKHLDLSFNWIEDGAAAWLLLALELVPSLTHLNLGHNSYASQPQPSAHAPSWQPSVAYNTPTKKFQTAPASSSQSIAHSHSGQLWLCTGQLEERESRNRGFAFISHLLSYKSHHKGRIHTLLSRLEKLESLDIRGMVLPAW
jgi:hypothetical protein